MTTNREVTHLNAHHIIVGEHHIDVTNWAHYGKPREVKINWPSIGSVDIETAKRFVADLQKAITVADLFTALNKTA